MFPIFSEICCKLRRIYYIFSSKLFRKPFSQVHVLFFAVLEVNAHLMRSEVCVHDLCVHLGEIPLDEGVAVMEFHVVRAIVLVEMVQHTRHVVRTWTKGGGRQTVAYYI